MSLVRGDVTRLDATAEVLETNLEEIVLAYLANGRRRTVTPPGEGR